MRVLRQDARGNVEAMSATTGQIEWYIARDGEQHGPLSEAELEKFIEFGHLKPTDLLWRAGFADWRVAAEVFPPATPGGAMSMAGGRESSGGAEPNTAAKPAAGPAEEVRPQSANAAIKAPASGEARHGEVPAAANDQDAATLETTARAGGYGGGGPRAAAGERRPAGADAGGTAAPGGHGMTAGQAHRGATAYAPGQQAAGSHAEPRLPSDAGPAGAGSGRHADEAGDLDLRAQWSMAEARRGGGDFVEAERRGPAPEASELRAPPRGEFGPPRDDFGPARVNPGRAATRDYDDGDDGDYADDDYADERRRGSGWLGIAATLIILGLIGAGGWFAYNHQNDIVALYADLMGTKETGGDQIAIVRAPEEASRESAGGVVTPRPVRTFSQPATGTDRTAAANPADISTTATTALGTPEVADVPLLKSELWAFAEREFTSWTQKRLEKVREMKAANESAAAINGYLVNAFVEFRRDNAALALLASSEQLQRVAAAFVASLEALTTRGADSCYSYISSGEGTAVLAPVYFEPAVGSKIETQMLAIMSAIVDARNKPHARQPPRAEDFDKLSGELSHRGWSEGDLKLFSNPDALSKAEPQTVCRLVTEWFATQTTLADAEARDRLIAASLRPVIGG